MPLVDVSYGPRIDTVVVGALARLLPHAVSLAVECPEEPYDHELQPGDVELRFRPVGPHDVTGLDLVVEVRSKFFESRARDRQRRCEQLCAAISDVVGDRTVGVYLSLPVAAWSQSPEFPR